MLLYTQLHSLSLHIQISKILSPKLSQICNKINMGTSSSSNRRRNNYYHQNPPSQLISSSSYPSANPSNTTSHPHPHPHPYPYSVAPPPPPPLPVYHPYDANYPNNAIMLRPNIGPRSNQQANYDFGWMPPMRPPVAPPPTYVDHQQAKKVRNDVNVHKDTLRVEIDEENPDHHLVSFVFDALFDGSITIYYFAKEEAGCKFVPEAYTPVKVPFKKGVGQRFRQPSGTGIDLGFFELDDLCKPTSGEDVFPLVISAETSALLSSTKTPHMQITQAILEKNNGDLFKVRVIKQILWIDGTRYELREIYGIGNSEGSFNDNDSGKECVICMTEPKDTAILPCRHMCMCSECAKALRLQSNKCPICRQPIEELMEIKISTVDE